MSGINIVGTGGIIEGTTNDVNVNVDLDSVLEFDGVNDKITVPDNNTLDIVGDITLSAWVKITMGESDFKTIISKAPSLNNTKSPWQLRIDDDDKVEFVTGNGTSSTRVSSTNAINKGWNHIAVTVDENGASSVVKYFINGVLDRTVSSGWTDYSGYTNTDDLLIGVLGTGYFHDGYLADVRIYNAVVDDPDVAILASRINVDPLLTTAGTTNLQGWWKLNNNSVTDSSPNTNNGTASGPTEAFDQFHVDLQDNNTGGSGTFKVTQGKVEGLALSSVDFSGDTQLISCTSNTFYNGRTAFSVSAWFNHDNSHDGHLLHTIVNARDGGNDGMALSLDSTNDRIRFRIGDGSSDDLYTAGGSTENDKWFHVVATRDASNNTAIYINGELSVTGSSSKTISISSGNFGIGGRPSATDADEFSGKIRDVGCWSYALSADQVAALCGGQYNVTPNHQYKLDEGYATAALNNAAGAFKDTGTETAADGQGIGLVDASCVNGTFTLDGTLTLGESNDSSVEATISAPRGIFHLTADLQSFGAITHNNGTFKLDNGSSMHVYNALGGANQRELTFYNLTMEGTGGDGYRISGPITIEKDWIINNTRTSVSNNAGGGHNTGVVVTLGTTTSAGSVTVNSGKELETYTYANSHSVTYQGVSPLYPALFTNNGTFEETLGSLLETVPEVKFSNLKFALPFATRPDDGDGSGGSKITLIGDCEFDDLTLTLGDDELHTDGHRLQAVDFTVQGSSTLDWEDSLCVFSGHVDLNGNITTANSDTKIIHNTSAEKNWRSLYADAGVFFANGTQTTMTGYQWASTGNEPIKVIAGSIFNTNSLKVNTTNLTIPYGGNFSGSTNIHSIAGDWIFSGGLIGKSGLNFDGSNDYVTCGSHSSIDDIFDNGGTAEFWIKPESDGEGNFGRILDKNNWIINVRDESSGAVRLNFTHAFSSTSGSWKTTDRVITLNKWNHVAITYDGSSVSNDPIIYVDGKSVPLTEGTTPAGSYSSDSSSDLIIGNKSDGSRTFDGVIDMARIFDDVRTQSEIRADMFNEHANMANTGNLVGMWQFDEGTGTTVDNVANSGVAAGSLVNSPAWAGGGTFTKGDSTIDMTGNGTLCIATDVAVAFNNLKVAASGKTTTFQVLAGSSDIRYHGTLTHGGGTANSSGNPAWTMKGTSTVSAGSDWTGWYLCYWESSTAVPTASWQYWLALTDSTLAGDMTCTGYFRPHQSVVTFAGNTVTTNDAIFHSTGGVNMGSGSLIFTQANGLSSTQSDSVFTGGPGATVTGVAAKSTFMSQNNFVLVGKAENLNVTNEELSVTGQVINCTGEIHQQFPTIDHDQQLDFDTADDRDIILGRDLDKNTELINS